MADNSKRSAPGRPFKKGQSGNPGGRPKIVSELREQARAYTEKALKVLSDVMIDKKAPKAARVAAAKEFLDRGYGKATQYVEANVNVFDQLTLEDKRAVLAALDALDAGEGRDTGAVSTRH